VAGRASESGIAGDQRCIERQCERRNAASQAGHIPDDGACLFGGRLRPRLLRTRFGTSYWDAAIFEAARALGCSVVLSEDPDDMNHYDGIRAEVPFRHAA
jgi:hypothetical protein